MTKRVLAKNFVQDKYFEQSVETEVDRKEQGSRELRPLLPYVISGGANTEHFYFKHLTSLTQYKFNVRPEYFGKESEYTKRFPELIDKIVKEDSEAQIFCVFDMDTVVGNNTNYRNHELFCKRVKRFIKSKQVVLCPSMPCFEYWLLLHFQNVATLMNDRGEVMNLLAPHMKSYFVQQGEGKKSLGSILKSKKYLESSEWAGKLLADGKLEFAINSAKVNCTRAEQEGCLDQQSYSKVFLAFEKTC